MTEVKYVNPTEDKKDAITDKAKLRSPVTTHYVVTVEHGSPSCLLSSAQRGK